MGGRKKKEWSRCSATNKSSILGSALLLCRYATAVNANDVSSSSTNWTRQSIPSFYRGDHSGTAVYDLNQDGYNDVLFAAGRYGVDQSYAMINLGYNNNEDDDEENATFRFSDPIPIGYPGGYFQIDVFPLSTLDAGHVSVLLVGGTCVQPLASCNLGSHEPAVLLDVTVTGCSVTQPDAACQSSFKTIWQDANPTGDRNGAFAPCLGDGIDPAIVLVGSGSVSIFEPKNGAYANPPAFFAASEGILPAMAGTMQDSTVGLSVGHFPVGNYGNLPGIIVGMRSRRSLSPLVAIFRIAGNYVWLDFASTNDTDDVEHGSDYPIETPGVAMGDVNGDGVVDVVESNFVRRPGILERNTVSQFYYLLGQEKSLQADTTALKLFDAPVSGRSVDIGQLFDDSPLPDIVHGMVDGSLRLFANKGIGSNNTFLGFEEREVLNVGADCEILEVMIADLSPCTVSLICALDCDIGNVIFSTPRSCQERGSPPRNPIHSLGELTNLQLSNSPSMAPTLKPSTESPTLVPTIAPSNRPTALPSNMPSDNPSQGPNSLNNSPDVIQNGASSALSASDFPSLSPTGASLSESGISDFPSSQPTHDDDSSGVLGSKEPPKDISQASSSSGEDDTETNSSLNNKHRSWQVGLVCFSSITVVFLILGLARRSMNRREQQRQDKIIQVYTNTSMVPFGSEGITTAQESPSIVSVYFVATGDTLAGGDQGDIISPTNVDVGKILAQALTPLSEHPSLQNIRFGCDALRKSPAALGRSTGGCITFWDSAYAGGGTAAGSDLAACETADEDMLFLLNSPTTSRSKRKSGRYKPAVGQAATLTRPTVLPSTTAAQF